MSDEKHEVPHGFHLVVELPLGFDVPVHVCRGNDGICLCGHEAGSWVFYATGVERLNVCPACWKALEAETADEAEPAGADLVRLIGKRENPVLGRQPHDGGVTP